MVGVYKFVFFLLLFKHEHFNFMFRSGGASSRVIFTSRLATRTQTSPHLGPARGRVSRQRDVRMNEARCTFGESETSTTPALLSLFKAEARIRQIKETELQFPVCVFDVTGQSKADSQQIISSYFMLESKAQESTCWQMLHSWF